MHRPSPPRGCRIVATLLALGAIGAPRADIFVDAAATCSPCDGTAPAPFPTIQEGIDAAPGGETVRVAAGTYVENVVIAGKVVHLLAAAGPAQTIIDGGMLDSTVRMQDAGQSSLDGFRVSGGRARFGGGVEVIGGGLVGEPTITRNVIVGNEAIEVVPGIDGDGGGICLYGAAGASVVGNLIQGNTGVKLGGGIAVVGSSDATLAFNTIVGNTLTGVATGFGPAIAVAHGSSQVIASNVIAGNSSASASTGAVDVYFATPAVEGNLFHQNQPGNFVSTEGPLPPGNPEADPRFVDAPGGDFRLSFTSPAIDGAVAAVPPGPVDLDGNPRPVDADGDGSADPDAGCFEHLGSLGEVTVTGAGDLSWAAAPAPVIPDAYHVYRSSRAGLLGGDIGICQDSRDPDLTDRSFAEIEAPAVGEVFTFVVSFERNGAMASLGLDSGGAERPPPIPCP